MSKKISALVTGASGYLASQVVAHLVATGRYEVRGTVRSLAKSEHLKKLFPGVTLYQADLLTEGSFDTALRGVEVVFHTASPFQISGIKDPQKELVEPALQGTLNVLRSVDKTPSVRHVVLTSSTAAIARGKSPDHLYSEEDWNLESSLTHEPYPYSKRLAEEAAWKFAKGKKWTLTAVNPSIILGEPLSDRVDAVSVTIIKSLLEGKHQETVGGMGSGVVSVHDVARAQIAAAENKVAIGQRYVLSSTKPWNRKDFNDVLIKSGQFKAFPLEKNSFLPPKQENRYDNRKVQKELGLKFTPIEDTVVDMAKALIRLQIVKLPSKL